MPDTVLDPATLAEVEALSQAVCREVGKAYIGSPGVVEVLLTCLVARGHALVEGVPGVAKTTLVKAFAHTLGCSFRRIQFTPDLLPSDITGTYVLDRRQGGGGDGMFVLRRGPVFAQVVLGDEINRAPAKTQSALLEAMQESQVTIEGETHELKAPFLVLATQNPVEHQGTYPLPEAQLDRFLVKLPMTYPDAAAERAMLETYSRPLAMPERVLTPESVLRLQHLAEAVHLDDQLFDYVLGLVRYTRSHRQVSLGASPRAALSLVHAARARALLGGRDFVLPDDVKLLATPVLAHRLLLAPDAELEGIAQASVVAEALARVPYHAAIGRASSPAEPARSDSLRSPIGGASGGRGGRGGG